MDWQLLSIVPAIFMVILFVVLLWGTGVAWKTNNKFLSFVLFAFAVAVGIAFYAIYGKTIFG